jgi:WD40 repeat protein
MDEMLRSRRHDQAQSAAAKARQSEFDMVPAYLSAIVTPTSWSAEEASSQGPEYELDMEYVHGFRGSGRFHCIHSLSEDSILYLVAMVLVVMNVKTRSQRFFRQHEHDITCFAVHPNGEMVASADAGQGGQVLVWNIHSMQVISRVSTLPMQSASSLCFSRGSGDLLLCVMNNKENTMLALEWESNKRAGIEKGGSSQVLAMAAHPDEEVIVTCGHKHIRFWKLDKGHMFPTNGSFGAGKPQTLICIDFTQEEDDDVRPLTLTGAQNGCIYVWREHHLDRIIVAHSSPILDICVTLDGALTCGIDGLVRLWSCDWTSSVRLDVAELTRGLLGFSSGSITPVQSVVLLMDESGEAETRRIVVGMETNEVYLFCFEGHPEDVDVLPETQILVQGHSKGHLCQVCAHPSLQEFATIGQDKTLRTWDCEECTPISFVRLPEMGTALAYFPDGKRLVAGLSSGTVIRIDADSNNITTIHDKRTKMVTRVKFSPSGELLAVGFDHGIVDVLQVQQESCTPAFTLKCTGSIEQVDFSTDEEVLQVSTGALDLSFWSIRASGGKQLIRPIEFRDKSWSTWSSRFGFPVQALSPQVKHITRLEKAKGPVLIAGLESGSLAAYRYPAIGESVADKKFHAHLAPLADVCFTCGDVRLISVGLKDCSIVQWKVGAAVAETSRSQVGSDVASDLKKGDVSTHIIFIFLDYVFDEWEAKVQNAFIGKLCALDPSRLAKDAVRVLEVLPGSVILKVEITCPNVSKVLSLLEADFRNPVGRLRKDLQVAHLITDEDVFWSAYHPKADSTYLFNVPAFEVSSDLSHDPDLAKPYISTSFQPHFKPDKHKMTPPAEYLELEHVHGFAGFNRMGNLFCVSTGELLYTVATVAIVHNTTTGRQSFFTKHSEEIVAVTVDKEGQLVATADNSPSSTIYVWSSITLEAKMRLAINPAGCVVGMCFSSDASKLVVVSEVKDASIEVFDW